MKNFTFQDGCGQQYRLEYNEETDEVRVFNTTLNHELGVVGKQFSGGSFYRVTGGTHPTVGFEITRVNSAGFVSLFELVAQERNLQPQ